MPRADAWCRKNSDSNFIPLVVTGHDTPYDWRCAGRKAEAGRRIAKIDKRYRSDPNQPLLNRAINDLRPPGSTFKLITSSSLVMHHEINTTSLYSCPGSLTIDGRELTLSGAGFRDRSCGSWTATTSVTVGRSPGCPRGPCSAC